VKARRIIPLFNGPPSEAVYFHKNATKRQIAHIADALRTFYLDGKKPPIDLYEYARDLGGLADLQRFLDSPDACHTTRGKLFHAYKTALADSDPSFGAYTDSINWKKTHVPKESKDFIGRMLWLLCHAPTLGAIIKEHDWTPPTLAQVRAQFCWLYPNNAGLWPRHRPSKDKTHRTTIRRMGLPLAKDRTGRPRKK
jgi:hypothetical protein